MVQRLLVLVSWLVGFVLFAVTAISNPVLFAAENSLPAAPVSKERLKADVQFLASLDPSRNYSNLASLNKAADYIKAEFEKCGVKAEEQVYKVNGSEYKNIICSFGPADAERLIVGAHYDVCDKQPGADDNATGVAGLLEIARLLKSQAPALRYRIDLVAYTLEEPPFFRTEHMGSAVHANYLKDNKIKVKAMVCLEMLGYFSDKPKSQRYPIGILKLFYPSKANYIAVVSKFGQGKLLRKVKRNMIKGSAIDVRSLSAPAFITGIDFSDHLNYWKHGFDAVMITDTSFYRNANYHEATDSIETLDFDRMTEVVKGAYAAVTGFN